MAKLGSIPLIPSIEGEREFKIDRFKMLQGGGDWRKEMEEFIARLKQFSFNKQSLRIDMVTYDEMDFFNTIVVVRWAPKEHPEHVIY